MAIQAFGVPRFANQEMKTAPMVLQEINQNIQRLKLVDDQILSIVFEQDMAHVFYKTG